jgi:hypothetical protein
MKALSLFIIGLTVCLLILTTQIYSVLTIQDLIMMSLICLTSLIGCLGIGYIALNSEE